MKKVVIAFLLGAMMSMWALNVVVPMAKPTDGGGIVLTGDPHPDEEWH